MSHPDQGPNPWQQPRDPRESRPDPWQDQPRQQGQSYPQGQPHPQSRPHPQGQSYPQGQPHPQGQSYPQGQPYPQSRPHPRGQPYPQGQPHPQGQTPPHGWPGPSQQPQQQPWQQHQQPAQPGWGGQQQPQVTWSAPYGLAAPAPMPNGLRPAPPRNFIQPRRPGAVRSLVWVCVIIVLAISTLLTLIVIGLSTGAVGSLVGLLFAILPVFPVAAALLWLDRYEDEPRTLLVFAFVWGATAAVVIALVFSIGSMIVISSRGGSDLIGTVVVAPIVEESAKGLAVIGVLLIRRSQFNGVVDGIIYAGLAGLGFAFAENILYLGGAFLDGGLTGAVATFVVRCIMGPFAHPMFTSAFGIGVGLAVRAKSPALKVVYPALGLLCAMALHALWNGLASVGGTGDFFLGYLLLQVPIFAGFVTFAVIARKREARLINQHLRVYAETGWITGQELAMLCSPTGRRQARTWADHAGGPPAKRAMRDFQEVASELSFLRERIANRSAPPDAGRTEADMLRTMWQLRLGFQPAPR